MKFVPILLLLLLASACTESYHMMNPYPPVARASTNPFTKYQQIRLFPPGEEPADSTYRFIAKLEVQGNDSYEQLLNKLKKKGAHLGADAILLDKRKWVLPDEYAPPQAALSGVAIKFPFQTRLLDKCMKTQHIYKQSDSGWAKIAMIHWGMDGRKEGVVTLSKEAKILLATYIKPYDLQQLLWAEKAPWRFAVTKEYGEHNQVTRKILHRTYFKGTHPLKTCRFYYASGYAERPHLAKISYRTDSTSTTLIKEELALYWRKDGQLAYMDISQKDSNTLRIKQTYDNTGKWTGSEVCGVLESGPPTNLLKVTHEFYTIDDIDGQIEQGVQDLPKEKW